MVKQEMNIPKIRFKGFSGEWEKVRFSTVYSYIRNGFVGTATPYYVEKGVPYIQGRNIKDGKLLDNGYINITEEFHKSRPNSQVSVNDLLMVQSGHVGDTAVVNSTFAGANCHAILVATPDNPLECNSCFYNSYYLSDFGKAKIKIITTGNTIKHILSSDLKTLIVPKPIYQEQTAIGNFFQQIDKLIKLQTRAVETAETYKKAMLQKMFPQKGEKVPRVRFEGFSGDWEDYALHKIANRLDSLRKPVTASERVAGTTPYYGANGIQDYVQGYTHEGEHILIAEDGANNLKDYPIQYVKGKIWVNNHAHVLATKASCNIKFLSFALKRINFIPFLVGGGRAKLNAHVMMQIKVRMPKLEEQIAIGNFFQKLDQQIEQQRQKLATYQQLKKAMLQRMFV